MRRPRVWRGRSAQRRAAAGGQGADHPGDGVDEAYLLDRYPQRSKDAEDLLFDEQLCGCRQCRSNKGFNVSNQSCWLTDANDGKFTKISNSMYVCAFECLSKAKP